MYKISSKICIIALISFLNNNANAQSNLMFNMPVDGFTETSDPNLYDNYNNCPYDNCYYKPSASSKTINSIKKKKKKNFTVILDGDHWPE